jgi:hypothetical protein
MSNAIKKSAKPTTKRSKRTSECECRVWDVRLKAECWRMAAESAQAATIFSHLFLTRGYPICFEMNFTSS